MEKHTYKDGKCLDDSDELEKAERHSLTARLKKIDKEMAPTQLRQAIKRTEVAAFRKKYPKSSGR